MNPYIYLAVPTYNHAAFLPSLFQTLIDQDYDNLIIHISNDASTDNTRAIINEWEPKLKSRFKVRISHHLLNQGAHANIGYLLEDIPDECEFVSLLESDDYSYSFRFSEQMGFLLCEGFDAVHSDVDQEREDGTIWQDFWKNHSYPIESPMSMDFLLMNNRIYTCTLICKKDLYLKAFDFVNVLGNYKLADYAACLRLIKLGAKIGYYDKTVSRYHVIGTSLSHSLSRDELLNETWKCQGDARSGELFKDLV